jgi:hypothetical protein
MTIMVAPWNKQLKEVNKENGIESGEIRCWTATGNALLPSDSGSCLFRIPQHSEMNFPSLS